MDFITKEFNFKPAHAGKAWQFYTGSHVWDPDVHVSMEGMRAVIQMAAEQIKAKGHCRARPNTWTKVDDQEKLAGVSKH